jgi:hypothetical protein
MSWTLFDEELVLRRILNLGFRAWKWPWSCWAKSSKMMHFLLTLPDVEFDFWFCLVSPLRWLFVKVGFWAWVTPVLSQMRQVFSGLILKWEWHDDLNTCQVLMARRKLASRLIGSSMSFLGHEPLSSFSFPLISFLSLSLFSLGH